LPRSDGGQSREEGAKSRNYSVRRGASRDLERINRSEIFWSIEEAAQGRRLAVESGKNPKEKTRGNYGSRKRLTVAGRKMARRAGVAWRKRKVIREVLSEEPEEYGRSGRDYRQKGRGN
jgi:hypothetical protein